VRILMPIAQFDLGHGGAEIQAFRLARSLVTRGHTVEIMTTRPRGTPRTTTLEGVTIRRFFSFGNARGIWRSTPYTFTLRLTAELLRRRRAHDLVHVQQAFHPAFAAVLARRWGGRPVIVTLQTAGPFGDVQQMLEGRATLPLGSAAMLRSIVTRADSLTVVSPAVADDVALAGVKVREVVCIPNGVDLPSVTPEARAAARRRLGLSDGVSVLFVGRASPQKGSDVLLAAWRKVVDRLAGVRLILLGEGLPEDPVVRTALSELGGSVVVPGRVLDVSTYLLASDLFVLPSRGEGLSLALMEAMAHELPCIVSDLPANQPLVTDGVTGMTVPVADPEAVASAIVTVARDLAGFRHLGVAARERIRSAFSLESVVDRYENLYQRLVTSS
jgi:glycogen synthase